MESNTDEVLSNTDLAAELKVPLSTIQKSRHFGKGPRAFKAGRHVRYLRTDVDAWIEEQRRRDSAA